MSIHRPTYEVHSLASNTCNATQQWVAMLVLVGAKCLQRLSHFPELFILSALVTFGSLCLLFLRHMLFAIIYAK